MTTPCGVLRTFRCALWIAGATLMVPTSAMAQQPGSAGAKRPNLRVLQALPEAQLFLLMNLVADSLGVRCDYCHVQATPDLTKTPANVGGWVWDSDDKPQKRTPAQCPTTCSPHRSDASGAR